MARAASSILLATILSGCAIAYEKPESGSVADFTFINRTTVPAFIEVRRVEDCAVKGMHWRSLESVGSKSYSGREEVTTQIEARGPFAMKVRTSSRDYSTGIGIERSCRVEVAFDPLPQYQYEAEFKYQDNYCAVELRRLDRKGEAIVRTPQRLYPMPEKCQPSLRPSK